MVSAADCSARGRGTACDHSPAFEAVCDALADAIGAERAAIPRRGHTIPSTGDPYNRALKSLLMRAEREGGTPVTNTSPS